MAPPIVKRFLISLDENKFYGLLTFVFVVGVFGVFALQPTPEAKPPSFKATGALVLRNPPPLFTATGQQVQEGGRRINRNILLSPRVLQKAAEELNLPPQQINKISQKLDLKFPRENEAPIIFLEYPEKTKPDFAQLVLQVFMEGMVEESRLINTSQLRLKIEAIDTRLAQAQKELREAEKRLYAFVTGDGSSLLEIQDGSLFSGISQSQQQQRQIQLVLEEIDGQINSLVKQLGLTPEQAYTSSALSADPIIASLRVQILEIERQQKIFSQDLRPAHPQMIQLQKQQQTIETLLQERAQEVIGSNELFISLPAEEIRKDSSLDQARQELANTLVGLQTQQEGLRRQLQLVQDTEKNLRQQYEKSPEKQLEQARLIQEVESNRALYQTILAALVDAKSAEAETTGSLAIARESSVGKVDFPAPQANNPLLIMAAGTGVGILAACGVIFLLATLDTRLHSPQEIQSLLSEREILFLGELPYVISLNDKGEEIPVIIDLDSPYLSAYERLRSNIRRLAGETPRVVLITSVSKHEGKSVSAYNLAIASAHAGKRTLLIEADLRTPSHINYFNLTLSPEASVEPLRYYGNRSDSIRLVPDIENLYVVASPGPQRRAAAIVESSELKMLLEDARRRFDFVIIDTPSLSHCNDALLLEPFSDGVILVNRPGFTQGNLLSEAIEQMTEAEIAILGGVINGVEKFIPLAKPPLINTEEIVSPKEPLGDESETEEIYR